MFVPFNLHRSHWVLIVANFELKRVEYCDSGAGHVHLSPGNNLSPLPKHVTITLRTPTLTISLTKNPLPKQ